MRNDLYSVQSCLVVALLAAFLGLATITSAQSSARTAAVWGNIYYLPLQIPAAGKEDHCTVLVGSGSHDGKPAFRDDVLWSGRESTKPPDAFMNAGQIHARLHLPNGSIVEPNPEPQDFPPDAVMNAGGITIDQMSRFPWASNKLDEAWVELRTVNRTYGSRCRMGSLEIRRLLSLPTSQKLGFLLSLRR